MRLRRHRNGRVATYCFCKIFLAGGRYNEGTDTTDDPFLVNFREVRKSGGSVEEAAKDRKGIDRDAG